MAFEGQRADIDEARSDFAEAQYSTRDYENALVGWALFTGADVSEGLLKLAKSRASIAEAAHWLGGLDEAFADLANPDGTLALTQTQVAKLSLEFPKGTLSAAGGGAIELAQRTPASLALSFFAGTLGYAPGNLPRFATLNLQIVGAESGLPTTANRQTWDTGRPNLVEDQKFTGQQVFKNGAAGMVFRNCEFNYNGPYPLLFHGNFSASLGVAVRFENCTFTSAYFAANGGTKLVYGGGGDFYRCHFKRGGDQVHITNRGRVRIVECIMDELDVVNGDHSDNLQISGSLANTGGTGGSFEIRDTIMVCRWNNSNGCVQLYESFLKADCLLEGVYLHGGQTAVHGTNDGSPWRVTARDCYWAWRSQKGGPGNTIDIYDNPMHWSRQFYPRTAGLGGGYTPSGEGAGFPGNGVSFDDVPHTNALA